MCEAWSRASSLACSWIGHFSMRRLDLEGPQTGQAASSQEFSEYDIRRIGIQVSRHAARDSVVQRQSIK